MKNQKQCQKQRGKIQMIIKTKTLHTTQVAEWYKQDNKKIVRGFFFSFFPSSSFSFYSIPSTASAGLSKISTSM
jgi:hypothetical protein